MTLPGPLYTSANFRTHDSTPETLMLEANKSQDWVLLADILEYEMTPFYKEWQTILTKLKNPH